jgi:hypothetical protein
MKDKIREICYDLEIGCIDWTEASEQLFALCDVSQQRELLLAYNEEVNQCMVDSQYILDESDVNEFLANNCG